MAVKGILGKWNKKKREEGWCREGEGIESNRLKRIPFLFIGKNLKSNDPNYWSPFCSLGHVNQVVNIPYRRQLSTQNLRETRIIKCRWNETANDTRKKSIRSELLSRCHPNSINFIKLGWRKRSGVAFKEIQLFKRLIYFSKLCKHWCKNFSRNVDHTLITKAKKLYGNQFYLFILIHKFLAQRHLWETNK